MTNLWVAFITGLTTGGLSCLAVQGGLLASSMAHRLEKDVSAMRRPVGGTGGAGANAAQPILLFLGAKLVAYTVLGFLLGALGSILQLNALTRAILQLGIGLFMIGNALRMLNVHPVFRHFAFEPPSWLTRTIRRTAKRDVSAATPLFLGALTVVIPCGVTQAMMATAVGTGDALTGAALMASFTLGTGPVFFGVAYSATRLGARLERTFLRIVAVVVLVLGFVAVETGLNMMGSPVSASRLALAMQSGESTNPAREIVTPVPGAPQDSPAVGDVQKLAIEARNDGYTPATQHAAADVASELVITTDHTRSCARAFIIPALQYEKLLPETGTVAVEIPPQAPETVLRYSCSMGMYTGEIIFDR
ncbi:MAG: sulfite exporter TauE/SafE family protein [Anaerolineae bacterium]|nr:sulfite exporter TauE/SafE family protein [Anaerolineae bacterium]